MGGVKGLLTDFEFFVSVNLTTGRLRNLVTYWIKKGVQDNDSDTQSGKIDRIEPLEYFDTRILIGSQNFCLSDSGHTRRVLPVKIKGEPSNSNLTSSHKIPIDDSNQKGDGTKQS